MFKLHDTYGFPTDLTADIARERGFTKSTRRGYEREMDAQREAVASREPVHVRSPPAVGSTVRRSSCGYDTLESDAPVVALARCATASRWMRSNRAQAGTVVLERTPFYAESGGQVGDTGELRRGSTRFAVSDTQKLGAAFGHVGTVETGTIAVGDRVSRASTRERRAAIVLNHSATHLLHAALRKVLGSHVQQKGSLVAPDRLRFDFSHYEPVIAGAAARDRVARER